MLHPAGRALTSGRFVNGIIMVVYEIYFRTENSDLNLKKILIDCNKTTLFANQSEASALPVGDYITKGNPEKFSMTEKPDGI